MVDLVFYVLDYAALAILIAAVFLSYKARNNYVKSLATLQRAQELHKKAIENAKKLGCETDV